MGEVMDDRGGDIGCEGMGHEGEFMGEVTGDEWGPCR